MVHEPSLEMQAFIEGGEREVEHSDKEAVKSPTRTDVGMAYIASDRVTSPTAAIPVLTRCASMCSTADIHSFMVHPTLYKSPLRRKPLRKLKCDGSRAARV